jgi:hypothetical protein
LVPTGMAQSAAGAGAGIARTAATAVARTRRFT